MRRTFILAADVVAVVAFVAIGRRNHEEADGFSGFIETVAPFLIALVVAWLVARAWQRPTALVTGFIVGPVTAWVGLALRNFVFDEGTELSFMFVATAFLTFFIAGWRLVAMQMGRRSADAA